MDIVENYELVKHPSNLLINYDFSEHQGLKGIDAITMQVKTNQENNFDLEVFLDQKIVVKFINFPSQELKELKNKRILLSGMNPVSKDIEHATLVSKIVFDNKNKYKI